jgi:uncharacterized protein YlbG (UPF0298 family)
MGVKVALQEKHGKGTMKKKPATIKIYVDEDDLNESCSKDCALQAIKKLRVELNDFYADYFFDVLYGKAKSNYTMVYNIEKPEDVMDMLESMQSYVTSVLSDSSTWCQCGKYNEKEDDYGHWT